MIRPLPTIRHDEPAGAGLEATDDGTMWVDQRFRASLDRAGLRGMADVMETDRGHCLRVLPDRENWYLRLPRDTARASCGMYLKKHHVRTWQSWLRAKGGLGPGETAGRVEAENIRRLHHAGVEAMELIAYGQRLLDDGRLESFVLTDELKGYQPLDGFLRARFSSIGSDHRARHDLDRLIRQVAEVAARLHAAGFNHRDLYCCHFFIREPARGEFEIRLIDLQRVQYRRFRRRRWLVKDLAQLAYSAPRDVITCKHRVAFLRYYLGARRLGASGRRWLRHVWRKQRLMEWKLGDGG